MPGMDEELIWAREAALTCLDTLHGTRRTPEAVDVEVLHTPESRDDESCKIISSRFQQLDGSVSRLGRALHRPVLLALEKANLASLVTPWTEEFYGVLCRSYHEYCWRLAGRLLVLPTRISLPHRRPGYSPEWVLELFTEARPEERPEPIGRPYNLPCDDLDDILLVLSYTIELSSEESEYYRKLLESVDNEPKYDIDLLGKLIWEECDRALAHLESLPGATLTRLSKSPEESQKKGTANENMTRQPLPAPTGRDRSKSERREIELREEANRTWITRQDAIKLIKNLLDDCIDDDGLAVRLLENWKKQDEVHHNGKRYKELRYSLDSLQSAILGYRESMQREADQEPPIASEKCPICGKRLESPEATYCSEKCKLIEEGYNPKKL